MKPSTVIPLQVCVARSEIVRWLRELAGSAHSLRDEDTSIHKTRELVTRFLSHAEPCGFQLSLLATGSLGEPRFVGSWHWHDRVVKMPETADAPDRDEARLLACAALLRDHVFKHRLSHSPSLSHAA